MGCVLLLLLLLCLDLLLDLLFLLLLFLDLLCLRVPIYLWQRFLLSNLYHLIKVLAYLVLLEIAEHEAIGVCRSILEQLNKLLGR